MSDDFWGDFIGDQNFDGRVDYYDQMIVEDECKEIGHVSLGGGGGGGRYSSKPKSKEETKDIPIENSFAIFCFSCFYFAVCTVIIFFLSLIPWCIIMVAADVDDTTEPVMIASLITGAIISLVFTIGWVKVNKEQLEEKRKKEELSTKDKE